MTTAQNWLPSRHGLVHNRFRHWTVQIHPDKHLSCHHRLLIHYRKVKGFHSLWHESNSIFCEVESHNPLVFGITGIVYFIVVPWNLLFEGFSQIMRNVGKEANEGKVDSSGSQVIVETAKLGVRAQAQVCREILFRWDILPLLEG